MRGLITLLTRSVQSFGSDKCSTLSAAIAYRTVFALFPMALVGVSVLGFFLDDATARREVVHGIASVLSLNTQGEEALTRALEGVSSVRDLTGLVGLLLAVWSASGLFGEIRSALNSVWDVDRPRPMLRAKVQDLVLFGGFGGLLAASTASTAVLHGARSAGAQWIGPLLDLAEPLFALIVFLAPLMLTFAAFMVLYRYGPHARLTWRDVLPAAVIAALFFEFGKGALSYYIAHFGTFNALVGSLGAAILFLVFVYYASQVILFAAEFAKHRMLVVAGTLPATDPKPARKQAPPMVRLRQAVARLWTSGEPHHDRELPYQPGRLDPATNRPTNTREEVLLRQQEAIQQDLKIASAAEWNGARAVGTLPHALGPSARAAGVGEVQGYVDECRVRLLTVRAGEHIHAMTLAPNVQIMRNGEPSKPMDLRAGDWVSATINAHGVVEQIMARAAAPPVTGDATERKAWEAAGFLTALVVSGLLRLVRRRAPERRLDHNPRRISRPSERTHRHCP